MSNFSLLITNWYRQNGRNLPWRQTTDPYLIWLSEIILQQTRVDQGMAYYEKFVRHYPTVKDLANAQEIDVLNDWQGLGYYSRARNLHFSAKFIQNELDGKFPQTFKEILGLKGVGKYTAAAIASFAFGEVQAVVDGNVYRVLSRVFDIDTPMDSTAGVKEFQKLADELISSEQPGEHNQAIMELGALICTPKPVCEDCPLTEMCLARAKQTITNRPVKSKKTKVRNRFFHFKVFSDQGKTLIEKRTEKGIWQNMFQFPLEEFDTNDNSAISSLRDNQSRESAEIIHVLSHQRIHTVFHHYPFLPEERKEHWIEIEHEKIQDYPLPRLVDRYLEENTID